MRVPILPTVVPIVSQGEPGATGGDHRQRPCQPDGPTGDHVGQPVVPEVDPAEAIATTISRPATIETTRCRVAVVSISTRKTTVVSTVALSGCPLGNEGDDAEDDEGEVAERPRGNATDRGRSVRTRLVTTDTSHWPSRVSQRARSR